MIYTPTYRAASMVAGKIEKHFRSYTRNKSFCEADSLTMATLPDTEVIEHIIDAAFWASLRKEEGHSPKISIAFLSPEQAENPLLFKQRLPLNPDMITKIAPGVERPGIHLGVWPHGDELCVWGTTVKIPNLCFVVDVSEPALLVIKHRRMCGFGKYTNVAVLKGDKVKMVDDRAVDFNDSPAILKALLDIDAAPEWHDPVNVLIQLAVSMRAHRHGGSLLVVPSGSENWKESIIQPIQYAVSPVFSGISNMSDVGETDDIYPRGGLVREIEHIAGLTAVDGATVISDRHELLAFGAKIGRKRGGEVLDSVAVIEPVEGSSVAVVSPGQIGGTRHISAAQFVYDQRDAVAFVASQDGYFTVFSWSDARNMLMAYRIDTLLL